MWFARFTSLLGGSVLPLACLCVAAGSFRATSCLYLRGSILPLSVCAFDLLVSCRFVACICLLLGGSVFTACLPVLCGLARCVPVRACIWLVARLLPLACL